MSSATSSEDLPAAGVGALLPLVALAASAIAGPSWPAITAGALAVTVVVAFAPSRLHTPATRSLGRFVMLLLAALLVGGPWQLSMALALALFVASDRNRTIAETLSWSSGRTPWLATLLVGGVTPLALVGWLLVVRPDLSDVLEGYVPDLPLALLVVGAIGFAVINALLEELIWRGVLQDRLSQSFGPRAAIVLQAASFGLQHAHGVPRGAIGVTMVFAWGIMLGWLRRHSGGMRAPLVAHIVADATIAVIILSLLDGGP